MSKPILKLTSAEQRKLESMRELLRELEKRVQGGCKDAAALKETLFDGQALVLRVQRLAAVPV